MLLVVLYRNAPGPLLKEHRMCDVVVFICGFLVAILLWVLCESICSRMVSVCIVCPTMESINKNPTVHLCTYGKTYLQTNVYA